MDGGSDSLEAHHGSGHDALGPLGSSLSNGAAEKDGNTAVDDQMNHSDTPPRTYSVTACELCKARKVKCDRAEPSCSWCSRHGRICVYKGRQKPGFRAGSVRDLEHKVDRLEAMLQLLGNRVEDHIQVHDSRSGSGFGSLQLPRPAGLPSLQAPSPDYQPQNVTRLYDNNNSQRYTATSLAGESPGVAGQGQSPGKSYGTMNHDRTSKTMSIYSMTTEPTALGDVSEYQRSPSATGPANVGYYRHSPSTSEFELPPHDLLYALVDLYFKHVNTWCPILDRKITFNTFFNSTGLDDPDRVVLHAIVATSLRFYEGPNLPRESRERYYDIAKQRVLLYGMQMPTVKALQALVILAFDFFGVSDGPQSWNILAMLVGNVRRLRLNTENSLTVNPSPHPSSSSSSSPSSSYQSVGTLQEFVLPPPTSWIEDEGRRRLFWMVYTLDRYVAVGNASNFLLNEAEVGRSLPCRYDLFSKNHPVGTRWFDGPGRSEVLLVNRPENLGSFSHHCDVLRTMSRVQVFLRQPVDICSLSEVQGWQATYRELDGKLNSWLYDLPDEYSRVSQLCHSDPTSKISNWIMIHAAFVTAVLRLHSCAAYPTVRSHIFTPSYIAMQRCLAAVQSLREIAQDVVNTGMLSLLGPHFAFSLWVSARLLLVHAASTGDEVDRKIHFFILTLQQMGPYWPVARRYAQLLLRALQVAENEVTSHSPPTTPTPTPISISKALAAMRRSAYDIYLTLSQRPSSPSTKHVTPHELESFELFDFFNCPRLPSALLDSPSSIFDSLRNVGGPAAPAPAPAPAPSGSGSGPGSGSGSGSGSATHAPASSASASAAGSASGSTSSAPLSYLLSGSFGLPEQQPDWLSFGRSG